MSALSDHDNRLCGFGAVPDGGKEPRIEKPGLVRYVVLVATYEEHYDGEGNVIIIDRSDLIEVEPITDKHGVVRLFSDAKNAEAYIAEQKVHDRKWDILNRTYQAVKVEI